MNPLREFRLQGAPVSDGVAMGHLFFLTASTEEVIPEFLIAETHLGLEVTRYRKAIACAKEDLLFLKMSLEKEGHQDALEIIESHIQMLEDPLITTHVEESIQCLRKNAEFVFHSVVKDYEKKFSKINDPFFKQRIIDVLDLSKRVLDHLLGKNKFNFSEIPQNSVIFAKELNPSHAAAIQASHIGAFITQQGGGSSHAALIARAKGIPYVSSIDITVLQKLGSGYVIVDGQSGEVIFHPSTATLKKYQETKTRIKTTYKLLQQDRYPITETVDGYPIHIYANIGNLVDLEEMHVCRSEGIGLFRSEYLFLEKNTIFLSEEEQYQAYLEVVSKAQGLPIVVRVFDIGGDKNPSLFSEYEKESNPVLGCRGIRFLLRHPVVFRTQLRAIMRACVGVDLRILLPLISDIQEVIEAKKMIKEVQEELFSQGLGNQKSVPIGCMIEVPSAAFLSGAIAQESDFLSIGTNDLVQYTLGIDRTISSSYDFFCPAHPSIIRMIKMVALEAKRQNKPVTICGEMASSPLFVPLLIGLGLNEFSCSPRYIPLIKRAIRRCTLIESYKFAHKLLQMNSYSEISESLAETYGQIFSDFSA